MESDSTLTIPAGGNGRKSKVLRYIFKMAWSHKSDWQQQSSFCSFHTQNMAILLRFAIQLLSGIFLEEGIMFYSNVLFSLLDSNLVAS